MRKLVLLISAVMVAACAAVERAVEQKDPVPDRVISEPDAPESAVSGGGSSRTQGGAPQGSNIGSEVSRSRQR